MATTVSQPRLAAIAAVLARSAEWTSARRKSDGRPFFFVPGSTEGAVYMADAKACTCPAAQRYSGPCKHSLAIRERQAPKKGYAELYPVCSVSGCDEDALRSGRCLEHRSQAAS